MEYRQRFIVDFQAFKIKGNQFVLKELVIVRVESDEIIHCLIKSPFPYSELWPYERCQVDYLYNNIHKIRWEDGYVTFSEAVKVLKNILKNASSVYIKGRERANYLRALLQFKVVVHDLDTLNCPRSVDWVPTSGFQRCSYPGHRYLARNTHIRCGLKNALIYKDWFKNEFSNFPKQ